MTVQEFEFTDGVVASGTATLCTRAQVKGRLGIELTGDDTIIDDHIRRVTSRLATFCRREFMPRVTEKRRFEIRDRLLYLGDADLVSATVVELHPESTAPVTLDSDDYRLTSLSELTGTYKDVLLANTVSLNSTTMQKFEHALIDITGTWGCWADVNAVHEDVVDAAIITVASWLNRPASTVASFDQLDPRAGVPATPQTWDIPRAAFLKLERFKSKRSHIA